MVSINCNIGQKINVAISSNIEAEVNTTPRDTRVGDGWYSQDSVGMDGLGTMYWWSVVVDDGVNSSSEVYQFTTKNTP